MSGREFEVPIFDSSMLDISSISNSTKRYLQWKMKISRKHVKKIILLKLLKNILCILTLRKNEYCF